MKTIFFVHQSIAGEQMTEGLLRAALGDTLRWCDFGPGTTCCHAAACKYASEFDRAGYQLVVRACVDDGSLDFQKTSDLVLVQNREPTLRAFEGYENALARGRTHSVDALQAWLANQAILAVDFWRRWGTPAIAPRRLILRAEDLRASARDKLEELLSEAGIDIEDAALSDAAGRIGDPAGQASIRALESHPHFVRPYFAEFMNLLAEEAAYLGYPTWQDPKPAAGPVTTIYRSRRALMEGDFDAVIALLGPFVAVNTVEPEIRAVLGEALLQAGREVEGRRALENLLKTTPDYFEAYGIWARHAYRLGLSIEARGVLREAGLRRGGPEWVQGFLLKSKLDPDFLRTFPVHADPPVSRDAVIAGFTWILGRQPENEIVVDGHRSLHDDDDLRLSLLRSQEFREFYERFEAGADMASDGGEPVTRGDLLAALRWILARPLRSREEAHNFLAAPSKGALRLTLVGEDEFRQSYAHAAEIA